MQFILANYLQLTANVTLSFIIAMLVGCAHTADDADRTYHADSWRSLISESCHTYFDGCNTCTRNPDTGVAACTRKACEQYQQPKCLDNVASVVGPQTVQFRCNDKKHFRVFYGIYTIGNKAIKLEDSQVMYVDGATRIAEVMTRQPSASGEKFVSGDTVLLINGDEAIVNKGNNILYTNCFATATD